MTPPPSTPTNVAFSTVYIKSLHAGQDLETNIFCSISTGIPPSCPDDKIGGCLPQGNNIFQTRESTRKRYLLNTSCRTPQTRITGANMQWVYLTQLRPPTFPNIQLHEYISCREYTYSPCTHTPKTHRTTSKHRSLRFLFASSVFIHECAPR